LYFQAVGLAVAVAVIVNDVEEFLVIVTEDEERTPELPSDAEDPGGIVTEPLEEDLDDPDEVVEPDTPVPDVDPGDPPLTEEGDEVGPAVELEPVEDGLEVGPIGVADG